MAVDRDGFARALLDVLEAPATPANVAFLVAWMARENTRAAFNPLASTLDAPGATVFNSIGVRNYPDLATGVECTRRTLVAHYYTRIVADLRRGDGLAAAQEHDELRTWSGGGYDHITVGNVPAPPAAPEDDMDDTERNQLKTAYEQSCWLAGVNPADGKPTGRGVPHIERIVEELARRAGLDPNTV